MKQKAISLSMLVFTLTVSPYEDGIAVGVVQNPMDTFLKKFVWLKKDLDEYMKLILAAASSVLFSFTNQLPDWNSVIRQQHLQGQSLLSLCQ